MFIASEVLEHIPSDIDALAELTPKGLDHVYVLGGSAVPHPHGEFVTGFVDQAEYFAADVMPAFR